MGTKVSQWRYNWPIINEKGEVDYDTSLLEGADLYTDCLKGLKLKRVGIKAPSGTQVEINGNIFIVNHSGTLTINKAGYSITSLRFLRPYAMEKDSVASKNKMEEGAKDMDEALIQLLNTINPTVIKTTTGNINYPEVKFSFKDENGNYSTNVISAPNKYFSAYSEFYSTFSEGYETFLQGYRGIYKAVVEKDKQPDLYNILIDIEYYKED